MVGRFLRSSSPVKTAANATDATSPRLLTPSSLNRMVRLFLDDAFGMVEIEGEISNLARPGSGHMYFSLKDDKAQVRCAWFKQRQNRDAAKLADGERVRLIARVSVFEPRGEYQLIVDQVAPAGAGDLARQFEQLKQKLLGEGLFDPARKRPIPALPDSVGLVTSPTGAAIRDLLSVFQRRFPLVRLVLYPTSVQGARAPAEIIDALRRAERGGHDVLILARGGGSLEDLQAFNDENLARCIANCQTPLVCGVGHETDTTIADLVADLRAATPSVAAESVVPDSDMLRQRIERAQLRLHALIQHGLQQQHQRLDQWQQRLRAQAPDRRVQRQREQLGTLTQGLSQAMQRRCERLDSQLAQLKHALKRATPSSKLENLRQRQRWAQQGLLAQARLGMRQRQQRLAELSGQLDELSPLKTLSRGYAVVRDTEKAVIRHADQVAAGDRLEIILHQGRLQARVTETRDGLTEHLSDSRKPPRRRE